MLNLANRYRLGVGVKRNEIYAERWRARAFGVLLQRAETDDHNAQFDLGTRYDEGFGVERDVNAAFGWFSKAESEHCCANNTLGWYYQKGIAVAKNEKNRSSITARPPN